MLPRTIRSHLSILVPALSALLLLAAPGALAATPPDTLTTIAGDPITSGIGTSPGQEPHAVAPAPNGGLYIVDGYSDSVRLLDANGHETTVAGIGFPWVLGRRGPRDERRSQPPRRAARRRRGQPPDR